MEDLFNSAINHLEQLVSFDTSNPPRAISESGLLDYLESIAGQNLSITDHGNGSYNCLIQQGNPKHLINVHLDTVPAGDGWETDPFKLHKENDVVRGLGACDIKGAAAALLSLIESYDSEYAILFSTDEEAGNSTCIKKFLEVDHPYEGIIVAEPTNNLAVTCHRGIFTGTKKFKGKAGHSSEKRGLQDSAIHKLVHWSEKALKVAADHTETSYENLHGLAFNLGHINGGIKPNIIAESAEVRLGLRPLPNQDIGELVAELGLSDSNEEEFIQGFSGPSLPAQGSSNDLKAFANKLNLSLSSPVNFWTEASLFNEAGYPAIVIGPGNIENAHQANEFIHLSQIKESIEIYKGLLK